MSRATPEEDAIDWEGDTNRARWVHSLTNPTAGTFKNADWLNGQGFKNVRGDVSYCSSTSDAANPEIHVFTVEYAMGRVLTVPKTSGCWTVWPVRGP